MARRHRRTKSKARGKTHHRRHAGKSAHRTRRVRHRRR